MTLYRHFAVRLLLRRVRALPAERVASNVPIGVVIGPRFALISFSKAGYEKSDSGVRLRPAIARRLAAMKWLRAFLELIGNLGGFAARAVKRFFVSPIEFMLILSQIEEVGWRSVPLVVSSGFAVGLVLTLHTRSTLVRFGAGSMIPSVQSIAFFAELGPLLAGLLVAGRAGAGIGAELAGMRVNEEIDAIETFSFDSFTVLVVPRILACVIALPLLTVFTDAAGIAGGYVAESMTSHTSVRSYLTSAFSQIDWATFIPPTLKTAVFGFIIGLISSWYGFTATNGSEGVGRAATQSVVASSLAIILADVILVKAIFFFFPGGAI